MKLRDQGVHHALALEQSAVIRGLVRGRVEGLQEMGAPQVVPQETPWKIFGKAKSVNPGPNFKKCISSV